MTPAVRNDATEDVPLSKHFAVGHKLGDGAFGIVFSCSRRSTGEEFAVKMVNTVDNNADDVLKEAYMLQMLDHPNIVKFYGLFTHSKYLCIVMEKLSGGDMVEGLQTHLNRRGNIKGEKIVGAVGQMASSIQYLHHKMVVHRDVKGDNFLLDRVDVADPACRIVLTDFGAACHMEKGERLKDVVGTKKFSPPEFFDRNYGTKVDVWALGVVMYGLATGRFPFRDEKDVRNKQIYIPSTVQPAFADMITRMLVKDEASRIDSDQVMRHEYLNPGSKSPGKAVFVHMSKDMLAQEDQRAAGALRTDTPRSRTLKAGTWGKSTATSVASTREPSPDPREGTESFKLATAKLQAACKASPSSSPRSATKASRKQVATPEDGRPAVNLASCINSMAPSRKGRRDTTKSGEAPMLIQDKLSVLQVLASCLLRCILGLRRLHESRQGSALTPRGKTPGAENALASTGAAGGAPPCPGRARD